MIEKGYLTSIDETLKAIITPSKSGLESNSNEGVHYIPRIPKLEPRHQIQFNVMPRNNSQ